MRRLLLVGCVALFCCAGRAGVAMPPKWSEGGNRIEVYNLDLEKIGGTSVKRPVDGIACLDGVIYAGLGPAKDSALPGTVEFCRKNIAPERGAFISRRRATMLIFR